MAVVSHGGAPRGVGIVLSSVSLLPSCLPVDRAVNSQTWLEPARGRFQVLKESRPRTANSDAQKQQHAEDRLSIKAV